jgi:hypothetical protein
MQYSQILDEYVLYDNGKEVTRTKDIWFCVASSDSVFMMIRHGKKSLVDEYIELKASSYKKFLNIELKSVNMTDEYSLDDINNCLSTTGYINILLNEIVV